MDEKDERIRQMESDISSLQHEIHMLSGKNRLRVIHLATINHIQMPVLVDTGSEITIASYKLKQVIRAVSEMHDGRGTG